METAPGTTRRCSALDFGIVILLLDRYQLRVSNDAQQRDGQDFRAWPQPSGSPAEEISFAWKEVRVRRIGHGVLLEPIDLPFDVKAWFDRIDAQLDEPFMADGRQQPAMPSPRDIFDE